MIIGTGIDIVEIGRIKNIFDRHPGFIERVFSIEEVRYFENRKMNPATIAGGFAAKEAAAKALGTGIRQFGWKDIIVVRDNFGKPVIKLKGNAGLKAREAGIKGLMASISHSRRYAVASVLALGGEEDVDYHCGSNETDR